MRFFTTERPTEGGGEGRRECVGGVGGERERDGRTGEEGLREEGRWEDKKEGRNRRRKGIAGESG